MDVDQLLGAFARDREVEGELRVVHEEAARPGLFARFPSDLPRPVVHALKKRGIRQLYSHQVRALELLRAGQSTVVSTATASGKSLCAHLPVLEGLLRDPDKKALFLYPTKALSRDQLASLTTLVDDVAEFGGEERQVNRGLIAHVYDGDTPPHLRRTLREEGDLILTNPYMLHVGILPHHAKWARLFQGLKFVVIDELHTLRGVFGSHVANVLRRLKRIAAHYGARPTFALTSATIGNPKELAEHLVGEEVEWLREDGAPRGRRLFALARPPVVHRQLGLRRPAMEHAVRLARSILESGLHSIFFHRSRNGVEVLLKYLRDLAPAVGVDPDQIRGYRGGYLPDVRREIEDGLRSGAIRCVVATNALELGVDIGNLDVCVMVGYPGSVSSTFQRAGRAGRRDRPSLALMVVRSVATDQYLAQRPDFLFERPPESAVVDPDNLVIRASHVKCAAFELPFTRGVAFGGAPDRAVEETTELLDYLAEEARILIRSGERYYWSARSFPADSVSLDTGDIDNFVILDAERKVPIAEIDRPSAVSMVHPEAIYNLQGDQYYIESMDYDGRRVYARRVDVDYFTEAEVEAEIRALHLDRQRPLGPATAWFGEVHVRKNTTMYKKIRFYTRENIGAGDVHLPEEDLDTEGIALVFPEELVAKGFFSGGKGGALHALADLFKKVMPLWVRCDPGDVGATAELRSPHFSLPTVYFWDEVPGGVGLSERAFEVLVPVLEAMHDVVAGCLCEGGCPSCIGPSLAEGRREKRDVLALLRLLLRGRSFAAESGA